MVSDAAGLRSALLGFRRGRFCLVTNLFLLMSIAECFGTYCTSIHEGMECIAEFPCIRMAMWTALALELPWFLLLARGYWSVLKVREGSLRRIRLLLVLSPLLTAVAPLLVLVLAALSDGEVAVGAESLAIAYDRHTITNIVQNFFSCMSWYVYFIMSGETRTVYGL